MGNYRNKEMRDNGIFFRKNKGQNFLTNKHIGNMIVDRTIDNLAQGVIEIGPGMGALTDLILQKCAKLLCIEIDNDLVDYLYEKYYGNEKVLILNTDVLLLNLDEVIEKEFANFSSVNVISNIPYYITSPIIFKLLTLKSSKINQITLMMQKEVGERIIAKPNSKIYNNLSIVCQYYCDIEKVCMVGKNNFVPVPKVDSIVLKFKVNKKYKDVKNEEIFLSFIRSMFATKRKTILNNLAVIINDKAQAKVIIDNLKYSYNLRSENLTLHDFYLLYNAVYQGSNKVMTDGN